MAINGSTHWESATSRGGQWIEYLNDHAPKPGNHYTVRSFRSQRHVSYVSGRAGAHISLIFFPNDPRRTIPTEKNSNLALEVPIYVEKKRGERRRERKKERRNEGKKAHTADAELHARRRLKRYGLHPVSSSTPRNARVRTSPGLRPGTDP